MTCSYATSLGSSRSSGRVAIDAGNIAPDLTTAPLVAALAAGDPTAELRAALARRARAQRIGRCGPARGQHRARGPAPRERAARRRHDGEGVSDLGTARQTAEMGGGTAAAPVAGHYCAPERVARAPNVMVHPYAWTRLQRLRPRGGAAHR